MLAPSVSLGFVLWISVPAFARISVWLRLSTSSIIAGVIMLQSGVNAITTYQPLAQYSKHLMCSLVPPSPSSLTPSPHHEDKNVSRNSLCVLRRWRWGESCMKPVALVCPFFLPPFFPPSLLPSNPRVWAQGLALVRQTQYHLSHAPSTSYCSSYFSNRFSCFFLDQSGSFYLCLHSWMTGMYHHTQLFIGWNGILWTLYLT
jgi:hypothetical protein